MNSLLTGGMQYQFWIAQMGVSPAEGSRWRKKGMVKTERCGKIVFIDQDNINLFWTRMRAGEFVGQLHGICASKAGRAI